MLLQGKAVGRVPYGTITIDDLLRGLDRGHYKEVASVEEHLTLPPDKAVVVTGDGPLQIFIHRRGRVLLSYNPGQTQVMDACPLGPNQIFGLIETLSGEPYKISLRAVTSCEFDAVGVADFLNIIRKKPDLCFRLAEVLSKLYRSELLAIKSH